MYDFLLVNIIETYLAQFPRYSISKSKTTPPQFEPPYEGTPWNFAFKLAMLTAETLSCFAVKTAFLQLFCHTVALQTTDDILWQKGTLQCNCNVPPNVVQWIGKVSLLGARPRSGGNCSCPNVKPPLCFHNVAEISYRLNFFATLQVHRNNCSENTV